MSPALRRLLRKRDAFSKRVNLALSPVIGVFENRVLDRTPEPGDAPAPVFVIGAPRTGSTILYQALTHMFDVGYIDNLACTWCHNLRFGMWLSKRRYGNRAHGNFSADQGSTITAGGHAPSECGRFWYRWLSRTEHFVDAGETPAATLEEIRAEIAGAQRVAGQPMLFKNLNAGQRLRMIHGIFPDARFIFIRRDPRFVIRSILKARRKSGTPADELWSVRPACYRELLDKPETDMVAAQVWHIEKQIAEDLELFPPENRMTLHYRDLSADTLAALGAWLKIPRRAGDADAPEFYRDDPARLGDDERAALERAVSKLDFDRELFA